MFFTQEDYRKIEKWLLANGRKDTDFVGAATPLKGNETVVLVQNGKNVKASVKDVVEQLFLLGVSDFVNITDKYGESYISLSQAIELIPYRSRKIGQVVTFLDDTGKWAMFQFQGTRKNQWGTLSLWVDLIDLMTGLTITDSEDIVTETSANQVALKFADKTYNEADYSGLGRVYLRRNVVNVEDPVTGNIVKMNYLTQSMISKENTIYIIQYDYNLNKQTITIPEGCVLQFEGGSISNGTLLLNNTIFTGNIKLECIISGIIGNSNISTDWFSTLENSDISDILQNLFDLRNTNTITIELSHNYIISKPVKLKGNIIFKGNLNCISTKFSKFYYSAFITDEDTNNNIVISNLIINQDDNLDMSSVDVTTWLSSTPCRVFQLFSADNVTIDNCTINYWGTNAIASDDADKARGTLTINNCKLYFYRANNNNYDSSAIYAANATNVITNNFIDGRYDNSKAKNPSYGGIEIHGSNSTLIGNTIIKCGNAVNITNAAKSSYIPSDGIICVGNNIMNCFCGFVIWKISDVELSNIKISDNNIIIKEISTGNGVSTAIGTIGRININRLCIENNNIFYGSYEYYYGQALYKAPGINLTTGNIKICRIVNNIIQGSPQNAIIINNNNDGNYCFDIKNNTILDCGVTNTNSMPPSVFAHFPINVEGVNNLNIEDNKFYYSKSVLNSIYGLIRVQKCNKFNIIKNTFNSTKNQDFIGCTIDSIENGKTDALTALIYKDEYPNNIIYNNISVNESAKIQLYSGDEILGNNSFKKVLTSHNTKKLLINAQLYTNNRYIYIPLGIPKELKVGDIVKIDADTDGTTKVVSFIDYKDNYISLHGYIPTKDFKSTISSVFGNLINIEPSITNAS